MAPKSGKAGEKKKDEKEDAREATLQAVVLADTFERRFAPFSLERPRCLLPLANTPMIEYTLEFLANAGVEDIFVYCGAYTDLVEDYINSSKWKLSSSPFRSLTLLRSVATSVGDAMRDLDKRDLITGDFLLVSGDVVSNLPIEVALAKHRSRREKDKNAIMTMVLREAGVEHRTKSRGRRPVFVIDPIKERCLQYEEMGRHRLHGEYVEIDPDILGSHGEIEIREDLIDCYIDICTPDVLGLWSDNFDYQSVRKSFLYGVLKDYELNGKTIHTHILNQHYAARVKSLRAYDAITKDIISRWTYPLCPDSNLVKGQTYNLSSGKVYTEEGVILARSCVLKRRTVVGSRTSIGDGSVVGDSVLGRRCHIGKNVTIEGSYIWDDVSIGDGSVVKNAIIANESSIGSACNIQPGALISYGVRIAANATISGHQRITRARNLNQNSQSTQTDPSVVGKGGEGYAYTPDSDSEDSSASNLISSPPRSRSSSVSSISTLNSSPESVPVSDEPRSRNDSFMSNDATPSEASMSKSDFHAEAVASILDGLSKDDSPEVIHLELLSQRLTANADDHMMRSALVGAFMKRIISLMDSGGKSASEAVSTLLAKYATLLSQMAIFDKEFAGEKRPDQVDLLSIIEKDCVTRGQKRGESLLLFMAKELYDKEVVEEEGVLQWWDAGGGENGVKDVQRETEGARVRGLVKSFVEWLKEADSEEESEVDGEEESEEDE
ncbi:MAG: hypothetical protein MMC33_001677 [Icmadophila ericetorum]|nr:hypothetical protein [Icmadophila ericetorum]